ncbi:hypothetical protein ACQPX6_21925 [Actinomycetospora sp. CA-101289]|uniref:hypothetical protein n=1 Tax=Actinomycetospora sp. CA-101289 TaxID=3239893 RepID=UPI003D97789F
MEARAGQAAVHGLSASAILAVAEGLRWSDPQLSVALAEHVARAVGDDHQVRAAAERSAVLALAQLDRPAEVVVRALPHLRDAERAGRSGDAAVLRCEVALAAAHCGDAEAAEALLEPLAGGRVLPGTVRADALVAWTAARAGRGDVAGVDAAARQVADLVEDDGGDGADQVRRVAVQRSRARARRVAGDVAGAAAVLLAVDPVPTSADGGRQAALLVADLVEVLGELGRSAEAREVGAPLLDAEPGPTTAPALGRLRSALARAVHLPAGDLDAAERLAREASEDLAARGQVAELAGALDVLAGVAEARGDVQGLLQHLRRAHEHTLTAHEDVTRARVALAAALARDEDRLVSTGRSLVGDPPETAAEGEPGTPEPAESSADRHARPSQDEAAEDDASEPVAPTTPSAASHASPVDVPEDAPTPNGTSPGLTLWEELDQRFGPDAATGASIGEALARESQPVAGAVEPEHVPESDPLPEPIPETAPVREAGRRRRTRYREDSEPAGLLAAAIAARAADGDDPPGGDETPASDRGAVAGARTDPPAEAPGDASVPWWADAPGVDPADPLGSGTAAGPVAGTPGPDGPDDDAGATPSSVDEAAAARSRRPARARARWEVPDSLLPRRGDGPPPAGEPEPGAERGGWPGEDRANGHDGHDHGDRGHDRRPPPRRSDPATTTVAAASGRPEQPERDRPAPGGADDELARELALTLVDLLAEYQDPAVPLGGPGTATPTPARPPSARAAPRPSRTGTNGSAPRRRPPRGEQSGVPAARPPAEPDAPGPRLADLLADAMDVYHRSDPDPAPADDRRARQ